MKKMLSTCVAGTLLAMVAPAAFAAVAGPSANFTASGKILPNACTITLDTGDHDLGEITASEIQAVGAVGGMRHISSKTVSDGVNIDCDAPIAVAIEMIDNNVADAMPTRPTEFGIGRDSAGAPLGTGNFSIVEVEVDGSPVAKGDLLESTDKGSTWAKIGTTTLKSGAWVAAGTAAPVPAISDLRVGFNHELRIAENATIADELSFGTNATLQVQYL